jgi:tRNA(Ile2) C34 agmatinyltransferase TiaS
MSAVIIVIMFVFVFMWGVTSLSRTAEVAKGRNKCAFCGKRLKKMGAKYATTCKACGKTQSWA